MGPGPELLQGFHGLINPAGSEQCQRESKTHIPAEVKSGLFEMLTSNDLLPREKEAGGRKGI
jgi:hypothetical protein